jgi:hypothetical protein
MDLYIHVLFRRNSDFKRLSHPGLSLGLSGKKPVSAE